MTESRKADSPTSDVQLVELLEGVHGRLAKLVERIPEQDSVIESADVDAIQELLEQRSVVIEQMTRATESVPDLLGRCEPGPAVLKAIGAIETLLSHLREADRRATRSIERQCASLQKELDQARTASTAAQVYQGATNTPPPARFSDREV